MREKKIGIAIRAHDKANALITSDRSLTFVINADTPRIDVSLMSPRLHVQMHQQGPDMCRFEDCSL